MASAVAGEDHASYAQNLSELLSAVGHLCLVRCLFQDASAEGLSSLSQKLTLVANIVEMLGMVGHPYPFECYVPYVRGSILGGTRLFVWLTIVQSALACIAIFWIHSWRARHFEDAEMSCIAVCVVAACVFAISWLTKEDCGSVIWDAVWATGYALDDIALLPQLWMVAHKEHATWPLAHFIACISLATVIELFSDFVGMESGSLAGTEFASNCFMFVWNDCLALAISADFVYYYLLSLSRKSYSKDPGVELPL